MTRNELKTMYFNLPHDENKVDFKAVVVKDGIVKIISDTKKGYHRFTTDQGENAINYALNCKEYKVNKYQLIIK